MSGDTNKSFWEHLDDLRALLFRLLAALAVATVACFCFKDELFSVVLAPSRPDFLIYRLLAGLGTPNLPAGLVNTTLGGQLMTHFKVAVGAGVVVSTPIGIYIIARYLAPALYPKERKAMTAAFTWGTLLFFAGMATAYVIVFPFAYQFLANYEVSSEVSNLFTLESYIDNLLLLVLLMGVLFELPVVAVLLNKMGLISSGLMKRYRRHAILAIVTASAIITPTTDIFTLAIVSMPVCLLYELSIHLVK